MNNSRCRHGQEDDYHQAIEEGLDCIVWDAEGRLVAMVPQCHKSLDPFLVVLSADTSSTLQARSEPCASPPLRQPVPVDGL